MLIVCLYTYVYMYIRAKKANSTGGGNLAQAYPLSCTCMYNAENNIRNETRDGSTHIDCRNQLHI